MKKFLILFAFMSVICGCNSDKKVIDQYRAYVAVELGAKYLEPSFRGDMVTKSTAATSDAWLIPFERDRQVEYFPYRGGREKSQLEPMQSLLDGELISDIQDYLYLRYRNFCKDFEEPDKKQDYDRAVGAVRDYFDYNMEWFGEERFMPGPGGYYNIEWLLDDEHIHNIAKNFMKVFGSYSQYCAFMSKAASVFSAEKIGEKFGANFYKVIYQVNYSDNSVMYASCGILANKDKNEISIVDRDDSLLKLIDWTYEDWMD